MKTDTKHISELLGPWLESLNELLEPAPWRGCWCCGRLDCPEPDGEMCHAYVASVEIPDGEIPF